MAKKKEENIFIPMAMNIARDVKAYKTYRTGWYGINRMDADAAEYYGEEFNTGYFTKARNIDCSDSPILRSARSWERVAAFSTSAADGDYLTAATFTDGLLFYVTFAHPGADELARVTIVRAIDAEGNITSASFPVDFGGDVRRSVVRFNKYTGSDNDILGTFEPMLLIFPDCIEIPINKVKEALSAGKVSFEDGSCFYKDNSGNVQCPTIYYATAYKGRIFGVGGATVYASAYNDYTNWDVDTADDIDPENAWCSSTQSNVKATDEFTGITTYENNVIAFKRAFTHRITGTKNPFRVVDVTDSGAIGADAVTTAGGALFYLSPNNVMMYTGGVPKSVGDPLGIRKYVYEHTNENNVTFRDVCDGDEDNLFVHQDNEIYSLSTDNGLWGVMDKPIASAKDYTDFVDTAGGYMLQDWSPGIVDALTGGDGELWCVLKGSLKAYNSNSGYYQGNDTAYFIYRLADKRDRKFYAETVSSTKISSSLSLDTKRMRSAQLLCNIAEGGELKVYILYDGEEFNPDSPGEAQLLLDSNGRTGDVHLKTYIRRGRGTGYRLALVGKGDVKVNALSLEISYGGKDAYNEKV